MTQYIPEAGDIVWLHFDQAGHGHRSALVLSPALYNGKSGLMLCCPMTTQIKGYPFEVLIAGAEPSAVLADQVKSLDWTACKATHKDVVTPAELSEVCRKASLLIGKPYKESRNG